MMNCIKYYLTFLFVGISVWAFGQSNQDSAQISSPDSVYEYSAPGNYEQSDFFAESSEILDLRTRIQQQKAYKFLFLAATVFFALLGVLVFMFFYRKINKIHDMTKIQVREIQLRDTRIKNLSLLLSYSSQPMLLMDKNGDIKWTNSAFSQYEYFSSDEPSDSKNYFADIVSENIEREAFKTLKESGNSQTISIEVKQKKVTRSLLPISEFDGTVSGYALIDQPE